MSTQQSRLVNYLLVYGCGDVFEKETKGVLLQDLHFNSMLLPDQKFPLIDWTDSPLCEHVEQFAFPQSASMTVLKEGSPIDTIAPIFFPFVLTASDAGQNFGCALKFYEKLSEVALAKLKQQTGCVIGDREHAWRPKVILLISLFPFFSFFKEFLKCLFKISVSNRPLSVPIERVIANFMQDVPVPPEGCVKVVYTTMRGKQLEISRPPPNQLPMIDTNFDVLFRALDQDTILNAWLAILTEQKVLFCSSQWSLLTSVIESLCALLFPFSWQGVYMPLLPENLVDFLFAPIPFIAGIHSSYLDKFERPEDVVFVDIDSSTISVMYEDVLPPLPSRSCSKLVNALKQYTHLYDPKHVLIRYADFAFQTGIEKPSSSAPLSSLFPGEQSCKRLSAQDSADLPRDVSVDLVRHSFLRFFVGLLMHYDKCFVDIKDMQDGEEDEEAEEEFDAKAFVEQSANSARPLLMSLLETQMFIRFISDNLPKRKKLRDAETHNIHQIIVGVDELKSQGQRKGTFSYLKDKMGTKKKRRKKRELDEKLSYLKLFDDYIIAKKNRSRFKTKQTTTFLDNSSYAIRNVHHVAPPDRSGIRSDVSYSYQSFPTLRQDMFGPTRSSPQISLNSHSSPIEHKSPASTRSVSRPAPPPPTRPTAESLPVKPSIPPPRPPPPKQVAVSPPSRVALAGKAKEMTSLFNKGGKGSFISQSGAFPARVAKPPHFRPSSHSFNAQSAPHTSNVGFNIVKPTITANVLLKQSAQLRTVKSPNPVPDIVHDQPSKVKPELKEVPKAKLGGIPVVSERRLDMPEHNLPAPSTDSLPSVKSAIMRFNGARIRYYSRDSDFATPVNSAGTKPRMKRRRSFLKPRMKARELHCFQPNKNNTCSICSKREQDHYSPYMLKLLGCAVVQHQGAGVAKTQIAKVIPRFCRTCGTRYSRVNSIECENCGAINKYH